MKKSEMVRIINNYVKRIADDQYDEVTDLLSKDILQIIEKAGMKPPSYIYQDGDSGSCFKNEWEEEDEE